MNAPNILVLAGSLRSGSYKRKLASLFARRLQERGAAVTLLDLGDYQLPIYDADLELGKGASRKRPRSIAIIAACGFRRISRAHGSPHARVLPAMARSAARPKPSTRRKKSNRPCPTR